METSELATFASEAGLPICLVWIRVESEPETWLAMLDREVL